MFDWSVMLFSIVSTVREAANAAGLWDKYP